MSDKDNPNFVERFTIRMPDGMRDAVAERAKANGRSMNSEIIQIIGEHVYEICLHDHEFDSKYDYLTSGYPTDEEDWIFRDRILRELTNEITKKIELETSKLRSLFEISKANSIASGERQNNKSE